MLKKKKIGFFVFKRKTSEEMLIEVKVTKPNGMLQLLKVDPSKPISTLLDAVKKDVDLKEQDELEVYNIDTKETCKFSFFFHKLFFKKTLIHLVINVLAFNDQDVVKGTNLKLIIKQKKRLMMLLNLKKIHQYLFKM